MVADANEDNGLVSAILDVGRFFTDPFRDFFELDDNKLEIAINWGIAAIVYVAIAMIIAAVLRAVGGRARAR